MLSCLIHLDKEINYLKLLFQLCLVLSKTICDSPKNSLGIKILQVPPDVTQP